MSKITGFFKKAPAAKEAAAVPSPTPPPQPFLFSANTSKRSDKSKVVEPVSTDDEDDIVRPQPKRRRTVVGTSDREDEVVDLDDDTIVQNLPDDIVEDVDEEDTERKTLPYVEAAAVSRDFRKVKCPIFQHMADKVFADDHFHDVIAYFQMHSESEVFEYCDDLINSNAALRRIVREERWTDINLLRPIGGNVRQKLPGWYLDVVLDVKDDAWHKLYPGQATKDLMKRNNRHHQTTAAGGPTLHSRVAGAPGRRSNFVLLGLYDTDCGLTNDPALFDIVEMYFHLLFQTATRQNLIKWLPGGVEDLREPEVGVCVALPLAQNLGTKGAQGAKRNFLHLRESADPEIRRIWKETVDSACQTARDALKKAEFKPVMEGKRAQKGAKSNPGGEYCRGPTPGVARE